MISANFSCGQIIDPASGNTYYCNRATGESSWNPPASSANAPAPATAGAPISDLPDGWEQAKDPTGKPYYFNRSTNESRWDPP